MAKPAATAPAKATGIPVDSNQNSGIVSGQGTQPANPKPEGGKMGRVTEDFLASDKSPGDKFAATYFPAGHAEELEQAGYLQKKEKNGKVTWVATDKAKQDATPKNSNQSAETSTYQRHHAADKIVSSLSGSGYSATSWAPEGHNGPVRVYVSIPAKDWKHRSENIGHIDIGKDGAVVSSLTKRSSDVMSRLPELNIEKAAETPSPQVNTAASDLAKAARDYRAGKVIPEDLIVAAVQHGYLSDSEAMNRDW